MNEGGRMDRWVDGCMEVLPVDIWCIYAGNIWRVTFDVQEARTDKSKYSNDKTHPGGTSQI